MLQWHVLHVGPQPEAICPKQVLSWRRCVRAATHTLPHDRFSDPPPVSPENVRHPSQELQARLNICSNKSRTCTTVYSQCSDIIKADKSNQGDSRKIDTVEAHSK